MYDASDGPFLLFRLISPAFRSFQYVCVCVCVSFVLKHQVSRTYMKCRFIHGLSAGNTSVVVVN